MITKQDARASADAYVQNLEKGRRYRLVIIDAFTREEDFGWVFFYNSEEYARTGNKDWALAGNAPLIVDRDSGHLVVTGTAKPLTHYRGISTRARRRRPVRVTLTA